MLRAMYAQQQQLISWTERWHLPVSDLDRDGAFPQLPSLQWNGKVVRRHAPLQFYKRVPLRCKEPELVISAKISLLPFGFQSKIRAVSRAAQDIPCPQGVSSRNQQVQIHKSPQSKITISG